MDDTSLAHDTQRKILEALNAQLIDKIQELTHIHREIQTALDTWPRWPALPSSQNTSRHYHHHPPNYHHHHHADRPFVGKNSVAATVRLIDKALATSRKVVAALEIDLNSFAVFENVDPVGPSTVSSQHRAAGQLRSFEMAF